MPWPTDDPLGYFTERGFALRTWEDADGKWWADLTTADQSRVVAPRYGSGVSAADASLSAQRRYHVEQEPDPPLPHRLP